MYLRNRFAIGASEWLAGKNGSKRNDKNILDYTDDEWAYIWSTMLEDGAWAVPSIKDELGNIIKQNYAPELFINYIAHDLKSHIIVFIYYLIEFSLSLGITSNQIMWFLIHHYCCMPLVLISNVLSSKIMSTSLNMQKN